MYAILLCILRYKVGITHPNVLDDPPCVIAEQFRSFFARENEGLIEYINANTSRPKMEPLFEDFKEYTACHDMEAIRSGDSVT